MRAALRSVYRTLLYRRASELAGEALSAPAVVFAPHPDDEVLGCGGMVLRKKEAGAEVKIAFMTDGSASHAGRMPAAQLKEMRRQEALDAGRRLGLTPEDLYFFELEDGHLSLCQAEAASAAAALLSSARPAQVFVPCALEKPSDHRATRSAVLAALRASGLSARVFETPIWFWDHWPWTSTCGASLASAVKKSWKRDVRYLLHDFRATVPIAPVLERKRAALNEHRSQMQSDGQVPGWMTLERVADGEWLDCFFQPYEVFASYLYPGPAGS